MVRKFYLVTNESAPGLVGDANPLPVAQDNDGAVQQNLFRYLDTVGDGSGTKDAVGNYAGAVEEFKIVPAAGEVMRIHRLIVSAIDTTGMDADKYGNGITLTNGIFVKTKNASGTILDLTDGEPILTNGAWAHLCYDADVKTWGSGNDHLVVRWTFSKSGAPIRLVGDDGEYLSVDLNDSFAGLLGHFFMVQGVYE